MNRNVRLLGGSLLVFCLLAGLLHVHNGSHFQGLADLPRIGNAALQQLYDKSVEETGAPSAAPTPAPSVKMGGEPVIMKGSYITDSTNKTISKKQLG